MVVQLQSWRKVPVDGLTIHLVISSTRGGREAFNK